MPVFDVVVNVIGYVRSFSRGAGAIPGCARPRIRIRLCLLAPPELRPRIAAALSSDPHFSNLDLLANAAGGALGALAAVAGTRRCASRKAAAPARALHAPRPPDRSRARAYRLWLLSQLNPETLLFGTGDLRELFARLRESSTPQRSSCAWKPGSRAGTSLPLGCSCSACAPAGSRCGTRRGTGGRALAVRCFAFAC